MNNTEGTSPPRPQSRSRPAAPALWPVGAMGLMALGMVAGAGGGFLRGGELAGERAWAERKKGLEAQQESLDWAAYIRRRRPGSRIFSKRPKCRSGSSAAGRMN